MYENNSLTSKERRKIRKEKKKLRKKMKERRKRKEYDEDENNSIVWDEDANRELSQNEEDEGKSINEQHYQGGGLDEINQVVVENKDYQSNENQGKTTKSNAMIVDDEEVDYN